MPAFSPELRTIKSDADLGAALTDVRRAGQMALRVQTDRAAPVDACVCGLAFAAGPERGYYVRIGSGAPPGAAETGGLFAEDEEHQEPAHSVPLERFAELLLGESVARHGYDLKADEIVLTQNGAPLDNVGAHDFDALIAAYILNPGRSAYPLMDLAAEHLGLRAELADAFDDPAKLATEAALIAALRAPMRARIEADGASEILDRIEMPLVPVLAEMQRVGVPVDRAWLERLSREMGARIAEIAARIYELAGEEFAIGSTQQLQRILFEKLQLPTGKRIKTGYSTRADLLEALAPQYAIAQRILEWRELSKLKSTYADALPKLMDPRTGRIHTNLNQTVTATGRLSSSDPNLQNIPVRSEIGREIRKAFIAPPGQVLLSCDYSQIELRVFAHVTKDPELLRAFAADEDIHAATASRVFNVPLDAVTADMRRRAKTVNFAVIYGQSDFGLANQLGIPTAEAREFIEQYFAQFPGVRDYTERTLAEARERGYVQTLMGRRRYVPDLRSGNFNIRQAAERAAVNMPIQGAAADIMKLAMIDVFNTLPSLCYTCTLLLQVHDELVFAVDPARLSEAAAEIVRRMEGAYEMDVPLRVDAKAGPNWAEMTTVKE